ncbi:ribonuclease H-like domain-containing protein [Tanacetum coccineum]
MLKWVWRFYSQNVPLWTKVIRLFNGEDGKYDKDDSGESFEPAGHDSFHEVRVFQSVGLVKIMEGITLFDSKDRWRWSLEGCGEFTVASVRNLLDANSLPVVSSKTRWIKSVPIKVNIHAWKVKLDILPTRLNISKRGMDIESILCPLCEKNVESSSHIFFTCPISREIFRKVLLWWEIDVVMVSSYDEWLEWLLSIRTQPADTSGQATSLPHAFTTGTLHDPSAWNMDTGASSHLNSSVTSLNIVFNTCIYSSISVGDGHSIPVTNTGHSILPTATKSLHLNNVLITPHIVKNLIYVRQFVRDNNCTIEFDAFGFSVKDFLTRRVLLLCDSTRDLYPVTAPSPIPHAFLVSQHTWHQRLGHPGGEVLRRLVSSSFISYNKEKPPILCHACQLGKHVRLPFVSYSTVISSCFDIIHSDVWTSPIPSLLGNNVVPLRSDTIWLVQNGCSFHGLRSEDPNQHLKDFLKLVDSLDLDGDNRERTRLRLFQFSLRDQASNWLERLPAGSITTWEDLTTRFLA